MTDGREKDEKKDEWRVMEGEKKGNFGKYGIRAKTDEKGRGKIG